MTMKAKGTDQYLLTSGDYERKQLDVNLWLIFAIALGLATAIYAIVWPFQTSFIGVLLYQRGLTQYLVIYLASIVVSLILIKLVKIQQEKSFMQRKWLPELVDFENNRAKELLSLQKNLAKKERLLAIRCSRVIAAYIQSGSRKAATELALDDSTFYLSASESSYTFPRILVWAIPLLGFIGTVIGISQAVSGFSRFLEQAGEIEQIKEGIGTVTSGLAVAFDTTLLALLLSVLVMIPLVLVERLESRLLLNIDIYINDNLLPRFKEQSDKFDKKSMKLSIGEAIQEYLPTPETLIKPAQDYAQQAAKILAENFVLEIEKVKEINEKLIDQMDTINQITIEERSEFLSTLEEQLKVNRELSYSMVSEIKKIKPVLEKLSKPRLITFTDSEEL
ncbi:MAG TPA: flagellar motor protein MotA [Cyanothece sp. UBA12306]|nr:flagellar motor protein MotA [Cyanothece sp. UBA12306]